MKEKSSLRLRSQLIKIAIDVLLIVSAFFLARSIKYPAGAPDYLLKNTAIILLMFFSVSFVSLFSFGCYRYMWRYTSTSDSIRLVLAVAVTLGLLLVFRAVLELVNETMIIDYTYVWTYGLVMFMLLMTQRFSVKILRAGLHLFANITNSPDVKDKRVLIYGAGYTGRTITEQFINNKKDGLFPVAVIDDDEEKHGLRLSGVKVYGGRDKLAKVVKECKVDLIVIAIQSISKQTLKEIYQSCAAADVPVKVVPRIASAETAIGNTPLEIREIKMEELLGREEFETNFSLINHFIKNKVVLVTGGAGSIGSEICRQALQFECKHLIVMDAHENSVFLLNQELSRKYEGSRYSLEIANVRDKPKLKAIFDKYSPQVVFHAAAFKHVPMMEVCPIEAVKNNVFGTLNVIDQCNDSKVKNFVLISTDKAVNPANVMGATKRIAEMLVQSHSEASFTQLAAVRFGNVLGSNGSVIGIFLEQIKAGGPITLTHREIKRYFMTIPEAVRLVLQAGALASRGEVFVLDMGQPVFIYDLAVDLIKMHGLQPEKDIEIAVTGLRAGEKLFEELRFDGEVTDKTMHKGIFVCKLEEVDKADLNGKLDELRDNIQNEDSTKMINDLFKIVPSVYRDNPAAAESD